MPNTDKLKGLGIYSDLHCHPGNIPFHHLRNSSDDIYAHPTSKNFSIWNIPKDALKKRDKLYKKKKWGNVMLANVPQCDFYSLSRAKVRLVFSSMYAMEKGFFMGNQREGVSLGFFNKLTSILRSRFLQILSKVLISQLGVGQILLIRAINSKGPGRDLLQHFLMKFPNKRINYIQGQRNETNGKGEGRYYEYYDELKKEYEFYSQGQHRHDIRDRDGAPVLPYKIAQNGGDVEKWIVDGDCTVSVMTMEGMHCISMTNESKRNAPLQLVTEEVLMQRIDEIKLWPLFFVTFSHHFDSGVGGHARSIPDLIQLISDQVPGRNAGITALGMKAMKKLLKIGEFSQEARRVLIDVKHMAARSRKEFYELIKQHNANHPGDIIPIIASHVGYAGTDTLETLIQQAEIETDMKPDNDRYLEWGINVCDEDISTIVESGGLIGISYDERILGVKPKGKAQDGTALVFNHIIDMVKASKRTLQGKHPERIWDCLTWGTDFDGYINPVDDYPTSMEFQSISERLLHLLKLLPESAQKEMFLGGNPYTPVEVIEKINYRNALEFTIKHFK